MPDPLLDTSTPCCRADVLKVLKKLVGCDGSLKAGAGTSGLSKPATGTWSNSLNATSGGSGGGFGSSWSAPDPTIEEGW